MDSWSWTSSWLCQKQMCLIKIKWRKFQNYASKQLCRSRRQINFSQSKNRYTATICIQFRKSMLFVMCFFKCLKVNTEHHISIWDSILSSLLVHKVSIQLNVDLLFYLVCISNPRSHRLMSAYAREIHPSAMEESLRWTLAICGNP